MTPSFKKRADEWRKAVVATNNIVAKSLINPTNYSGDIAEHCEAAINAAQDASYHIAATSVADAEDAIVAAYISLWVACGAVHWTQAPEENPFLIAINEKCDLDFQICWENLVPQLIAQSPALQTLVTEGAFRKWDALAERYLQLWSEFQADENRETEHYAEARDRLIAEPAPDLAAVLFKIKVMTDFSEPGHDLAALQTDLTQLESFL